MGWYYYLEDQLQFPFRAKVPPRRARHLDPRAGDEVEVTAMAPEGECEHEMFAMTRWEGRSLPLLQLEGVAVDEETQRAIEDWHYWVARATNSGSPVVERGRASPQSGPGRRPPRHRFFHANPEERFGTCPRSGMSTGHRQVVLAVIVARTIWSR